MDETTYGRGDVAALIEDRFVPVRVDADRRPDVNERYNLGGWPTTAFLTARGDVLSGGLYFDGDSLLVTLRTVANAYRDRAGEIAARTGRLHADRITGSPAAPPDVRPDEAVAAFRQLLIAGFDSENGGFGSSPKLPHPYALLFALSRAADGDGELAAMVEITLEHLTALWDDASGGFRRYANGADWTGPAAERMLEDNAALLHVYVEAAITLGDRRWKDRAADIVRWVRTAMSDPAAAGFFNAATPGLIDRAMYVDRNAMMCGACIRAAALFDDVWLRDMALDVFESVIVPSYKPGDGVAHVSVSPGVPPVRGLLTDQIHAASAAVWAHAATGALPYSMLAAELLQFAVRTMWDEPAGRFRDRVEAADPHAPFELNCHAACVLNRLGLITGDAVYRARAERLLESLASESVPRGIFSAPFAMAFAEIGHRRLPAGLELSSVDWQLPG